jgi:nitroimidazol reductase NimA-like FMN-containing flavoprotein (pyridoxamine 5'-phosphate oxidase superfamily)
VPARLREMNDRERFAVLATQEESGPYVSLVAYALSPDLRTVIFATPKHTRKYKNLVKVDHVAILIDRRSTDLPLAKGEAITLTGRAKALRKGKERDEMARVYLDKHQDLKGFVESPTTALVALRIDQAVHVCNFQTVTVWQPASGRVK